MKKISLVYITIFSLSLFTSSCSNDSEVLNGTETEENHKTLSRESTLSKFVNDENVIKLRISYYNFLVASRDVNVEKVSKYSIEGEQILTTLFETYGKSTVLKYVADLKHYDLVVDPGIIQIYGEHDGSSCTRNLNGTTYWGNCSFWEGVSAYAAILLDCGHFDMNTDSKESYEKYANCNQKKICENC